MQPGMVVYVDTFRKQLQWLRQLFYIVDLRTWLENKGAFPDKACAITFDDGWRDTFEFAYPILQEQQVPATLFLVSDMIGTNESFWPEKLARLLLSNDRQSLPGEARQEFRSLLDLGIPQSLLKQTPTRESLNGIIEIAKRYPDEIMVEKVAALETKLKASQDTRSHDILGWEQVGEMVRSGLVNIGSHGRHHFRLSKTPDIEVLENEIAGSKKHIEAKVGASLELFCYPGGDVSPPAEELVRRHYHAACTTIRGWNLARTDRFRLKRISMHEDVGNDLTPFLARVSGWL
jgi:peptidoglycan/xylan/chitin deacetylase (PgdA/CDA1 family)